MSEALSAATARGRPRKFNHEEARRRHAAGESMSSIARDLGVSATAVGLALDPAKRRLSNERVAAWQRSQRCACGRQAYKQGRGRDPRCVECASAARCTSVRDGELWCYKCRSWKPDDEFPRAANEPARRQRHRCCRACQTVVKREYRRRKKAAR